MIKEKFPVVGYPVGYQVKKLTMYIYIELWENTEKYQFKRGSDEF